MRKEKINDNSIYNWISIFIFVIMDYIILRTLLDKNLFFNNKELITEYNRYMKILYPEVIPYNFREFAMYYFRQNMLLSAPDEAWSRLHQSVRTFATIPSIKAH